MKPFFGGPALWLRSLGQKLTLRGSGPESLFRGREDGSLGVIKGMIGGFRLNQVARLGTIEAWDSTAGKFRLDRVPRADTGYALLCEGGWRLARVVESEVGHRRRRTAPSLLTFPLCQEGFRW